MPHGAAYYHADPQQPPPRAAFAAIGSIYESSPFMPGVAAPTIGVLGPAYMELKFGACCAGILPP